jgi:hypothetical protein
LIHWASPEWTQLRILFEFKANVHYGIGPILFVFCAESILLPFSRSVSPHLPSPDTFFLSVGRHSHFHSFSAAGRQGGEEGGGGKNLLLSRLDGRRRLAFAAAVIFYVIYLYAQNSSGPDGQMRKGKERRQIGT